MLNPIAALKNLFQGKQTPAVPTPWPGIDLLNNSHSLLLGQTGCGKTLALERFVLDAYQKGYQVLYFAAQPPGALCRQAGCGVSPLHLLGQPDFDGLGSAATVAGLLLEEVEQFGLTVLSVAYSDEGQEQGQEQGRAVLDAALSQLGHWRTGQTVPKLLVVIDEPLMWEPEEQQFHYHFATARRFGVQFLLAAQSPPDGIMANIQTVFFMRGRYARLGPQYFGVELDFSNLKPGEAYHWPVRPGFVLPEKIQLLKEAFS